MTGSTPSPLPRLNIRQWLLLFLPLALAIYGVMQTHYWLTVSSERSQLAESQNLGVELSRKVVADHLDQVVSQIQFLADHIQQRSHPGRLSPLEKQETTLFLGDFSRHQAWFDQIRYLDLQGNEIIRINQNQGAPQAVAEAALQNKSGRYYFSKLSSLKPAQVYISPLDLNVEDDQIQLPVKPTIRVGVGIHSARGERVGYLLLNYQGQQLIDDFKLASRHIANQMMLVNALGYWLISPVEGQNWGFMLDHNQRFSNRFSEEWRRIQVSSAGQFESPEGLFSYNTVQPYHNTAPQPDVLSDAEEQTDYWKVVSFTPNPLLNAPRQQFLNNNGVIYLFSLLLALLGTGIITRARQHNEAAQLQSLYERSFRHVLDNIQLAAIILTPQGQVTYCNDYFLQLTGYRREELLGRDWVNLMPDDELRSGRYSRFLDDLRHRQLTEQSEDSLSTKQGQMLQLAWNNTYSFDADGEIANLTLLGRDVTRQRDIEDQLIKLSQAVEQSPNTVMITNPSGHIEYVNPTFSELTGYAPEEVLGQRPSLLQSGHTDPEVYRAMWQQISQGKTWTGTLQNRKKNGDIYWEKTTISPIYDNYAKVRHYLSLKEDITDLLLLELEVKRQSEETLKNRELAAVGQMATMVAHDLRNPLSSIKMALQILSKKQSSPTAGEFKELIGISQEQIRYMEGIISDLLSYSCPARLKPEWLTLEKLMETTVISLQKQIQEQEIQVTEDYQKGLPTLLGDPVHLRQVFSNLIINAIQATEGQPDPTIAISVTLLMTDSNPKIKVTLTDNGPGIDPCLSTKVFQPFFTSKAKGTGLGLAIVKQRVERHRGTIDLVAIKDGGTQACLILPLNPEVSH
ncbi:MAG: PAS domain S-box-containing protein [Motiliproteus sp.]|jgi:PAS domain S-box-containing protein